jgi:hypothetical protein
MVKNSSNRRRKIADGVEAELVHLTALDLKMLRLDWKNRFSVDPPKLSSRGILRRLIAWQLQADALGGLDKKTERTLERIADRLEHDSSYEPKVRRDLAAGVELIREWKGTNHKVIVLTDGFQYLGKKYRSLSDIARTITGTRWSGPRFFGLEQKKYMKSGDGLSRSTTLIKSQ